MTPEEYGREAAAKLPPLTADQRDRLRVLLAPMRQHLAEQASRDEAA